MMILFPQQPFKLCIVDVPELIFRHDSNNGVNALFQTVLAPHKSSRERSDRAQLSSAQILDGNLFIIGCCMIMLVEPDFQKAIG